MQRQDAAPSARSRATPAAALVLAAGAVCLLVAADFVILTDSGESTGSYFETGARFVVLGLIAACVAIALGVVCFRRRGRSRLDVLAFVAACSVVPLNIVAYLVALGILFP